MSANCTVIKYTSSNDRNEQMLSGCFLLLQSACLVVLQFVFPFYSEVRNPYKICREINNSKKLIINDVPKNGVVDS